MESSACHNSRQRLARLSAGTILYQCRISRVQKSALDVLGEVLCAITEALFVHATQFSNTHSITQTYENETELTTLRNGASSYIDSKLIIDFALTNFTVNPSSSSLLLGLGHNSWNPNYGLPELIEYAHIQQRYSTTGKRSFDEGDVEGDEQRERERLITRSIFENSGFINPEYSIIPLPPRSAAVELLGKQPDLNANNIETITEAIVE
jgi:hypothetical protein